MSDIIARRDYCPVFLWLRASAQRVPAASLPPRITPHSPLSSFPIPLLDISSNTNLLGHLSHPPPLSSPTALVDNRSHNRPLVTHGSRQHPLSSTTALVTHRSPEQPLPSPIALLPSALRLSRLDSNPPNARLTPGIARLERHHFDRLQGHKWRALDTCISSTRTFFTRTGSPSSG